MIPFAPTFSGVPSGVLDMTDAIVPFLGPVLVGLFLASLSGIIITALLDRWQTRRQEKRVVALAQTVEFSKAA